MILRRMLALGATLLALATAASAQDRGLTYTLYGTPGLVDMPSALVANDGQIAGTLMLRDGESRTSFTFQITPRLSGTFRYTGLRGYVPSAESRFYDRSFDLRYQITDEGERMPAIAVGLQDFMGTGLYSAEYLVATKTFGDSLRVTGGLGWGRLATHGGFSNPLGALSSSLRDRPISYRSGEPGGKIPFDSFFRGDAAVFGGVEWAPNDNWLVKVEYSSDDGYHDVRGNPLIEHRSPLNFGITWRPKPGYQVGLAYLYGSEIALSGTLLFNPHDRPFAMGRDDPPVPVAARPADIAAALSWSRAERPEASIRAEIATALAADGFAVDSVELTDRAARIRYTNSTYRAEAQGLGRVARILTGILPGSVESITLEPMRQGIPLSAVTFLRSDIESLENAPGGTRGAFDRATFADAGSRAGLESLPVENRFDWGIAPYGQITLFDARHPIQLDFGIQAHARYELASNLVLSGAVRYSLTSGDQPGAIILTDLHPVRRFGSIYNTVGNPGISNLQLAWYERPGRDLYSRVTVGYLEPMYGGVSAELLYKPVNARWAVGAELNYVAQRSIDMLFGFGDYCHVYGTRDYCDRDGDGIRDVDESYRTLTGHLSFYYAFENGFHAQLDLGRYLAGDWGATIGIDREFANGWSVGAYATFTDVSADDFGEGSFDKGIRFTVPFDFITGTPTRRTRTTALSSLASDGGARLSVQGRLYDFVREGHVPDLETSWGRFWR